MNGIHPDWTINTLKTMGSLIGPLIPMKTFSYPCSRLDYKHLENNGEPDWAIDPNENFQFDHNLMNLVIMSIDHCLFLDIFDETPPISPIHKLMVNEHVLQMNTC